METVKGFSDWTGNEAKKREALKSIIADVFSLYGFEPAETPIIENRAFVVGDNPNDEAVSDTYKLEDKGKRKLALRYEFTFQLKRLAQQKKLPYKRYQIGPLFRDEPVKQNRWRQFTQCDVDIVSASIQDEAEILRVASDVLTKLSVDATIFVNNRKLLDEILEEEGIAQKNKKAVIREIDKLGTLSEKEVADNLRKYKAEGLLPVFKKPESYFAKYESYTEIEELKKYCTLFGVSVTFLPSLARGLSYYNRTVFEVKTKGMRETICGGGSYLINGVQSTGISFGIERLMQLATISTTYKRVLIISLDQDAKAFSCAEKIRNENIPAEVTSQKISKALDYANSKDIPLVVFVGDEEVKKKKFTLRNMNTGKEKKLGETELIAFLKKAK